MSIAKNGVVLTTVEDWAKHAEPKHLERQWKDFRSAKETARA